MEVNFDGVDYLGGHPRSKTTGVAPGYLHLSENGVRFDIVGEYRETAWLVPWSDITAWDAGGPTEATGGPTMGRVAVGALVLGVVGALIASASRAKRYQTLLAFRVGTSEIVFLLSADSPQSVISQLQMLPEARARRAAKDPERQTPRRWSYLNIPIEEVTTAGHDGWEAVGVYAMGDLAFVLCKRPMDLPPPVTVSANFQETTESSPSNSPSQVLRSQTEVTTGGDSE